MNREQLKFAMICGIMYLIDVAKSQGGGYGNKRGLATMKITIAGAGRVGLSLAVLLAQHNEVKAVDIVESKVEKINRRESPMALAI